MVAEGGSVGQGSDGRVESCRAQQNRKFLSGFNWSYGFFFDEESERGP